MLLFFFFKYFINATDTPSVLFNLKKNVSEVIILKNLHSRRDDFKVFLK